MTDANNKNGNSLSQMNNQKINTNLLNLYSKKNYDAIAFENLKQSVNNNGDTIIHLMAKNLDKAGLELIMLKNPNAISYDVINTANKQSQLPIHLAMETIKNNNITGNDFINFMINTLGANPEIPDKANRIIVNNTNSKQNNSIYDMNEKNIKEYNNTIIKNIKDLSKLLTGSFDSSNDEDFIKAISNHYLSKTQTMSGGYSGKRQISDRDINKKQVRRYVMDDLSESNNNNSFVAENKNRIMENYNNNRNTTYNSRQMGGFMIKTNQFKNLQDENNLDVDEQRYREDERQMYENRKDLEKNYMVGGKRKNKKNNFADDWRTDDFILTSDNNESDEKISGNNKYESNKSYRSNKDMEDNRYGSNKNYRSNKDMKDNDDDNNENMKHNWKTDDFSLTTENDDDYMYNNSRNTKNKNTNDDDDDYMYNNSRNTKKDNTNDDDDDYYDDRNDRDDNDDDMNDDNVNDDDDVNDDDYDVNDDDDDRNNQYRNNNNDNDDDGDDDDDDNDNGTDYTNFSYMDMFDSQDRPRRLRDAKVDEMYKSFVKRLMDVLGIDEETAKLYRSAIKITIGEKNPELRKMSNDALKVKEMEKIFENDKKLKEFIKNIDMDFIKDFIEKRKEENEKRREEFKKNREDKAQNKSKNKSRNRNKNDTNKKTPESESTTTSDSTNEPKNKSGIKESKSKNDETKTSKNRKKTVQSRTVDDSYIRSDEIVVSPGY
jgi:hypothetical protein